MLHVSVHPMGKKVLFTLIGMRLFSEEEAKSVQEKRGFPVKSCGFTNFYSLKTTTCFIHSWECNACESAN